MILPELDSDFHFILNPDIQLTADTLSDGPHPASGSGRSGLSRS